MLSDYKVIYKESGIEGVVIFKASNEKWGAVTEGGKVIVEPKYDYISYYKDKQFVIATKKTPTNKNVHSIIDKTGNLVKEINSYRSIRIDEDGNIITTAHDKLSYGLLNDSFDELIKPTWESLLTIGSGFFKGRRGNLWGIIDRKGNEVLPINYENLIGSFHNSEAVAVKNKDGFFLVNKQGETVKKLPYTYILPYNINPGGARRHQKLKAIISDREERDDFSADEMYQYVGKWGILNDDFSELIAPQYAYIDFFRNPHYFKVIDGELDFDESGYYITVAAGLFGVIDSRSNIIISPEYNYISELFDGLWAVNKGGEVYYDDGYQEDLWTVRGGKWGAIDNHSSIIVPVKYDTLMTIWGKKDYIFAQNNTKHFDRTKPYDIYTFTGKKLPFFMNFFKKW